MNKTITINPDLFKLSTTSKKQSKTQSRTMKKKPIISSNVLKNKLLRRIQKYKFNEIKSHSKIPLKLKDNNSTSEDTTFSDEFSESLDFLKLLEKSKPEINSQIKNYNNSTMKNQHSNQQPFNKIPQELINIELPTELVETKFEINNNDTIGKTSLPIMNNKVNENIIVISEDKLDKQDTMVLNKPNNDVPYGVLKNGNKPTYRQWSHTQKNIKTDTHNTSTHNTSTHNPSSMNVREKKLSELRTRINSTSKPKDNESNTENDWDNCNYIINPKKNKDIEVSINESNIHLPDIKNDVSQFINQLDKSENDVNNNYDQDIIIRRDPNKNYNKLTKIYKKYTLGKSKIKNKVAMLIKNNATRKKVIESHKNLKKTSLNDIKQYLKERNLIKSGCQAPNHILRKIFENAKLSGDISNVNKKTLLDNILSEYNESII